MCVASSLPDSELLLFEVICINPPDRVTGNVRDAYSKIDAQTSELLTVDKNNLPFNAADVIRRIRRKLRGSYENSFSGAMTLQASSKTLDICNRPMNPSIE